MADIIHIRGLEISCHIGAGEEERSAPQILRVDLDLRVAGGLHGLGDDLRRTVDYHQVCLRVRELASARPRCLVETLAEEILALARDTFQVAGAVVTIRKFILPFADWVGVTLECAQSADKSGGAAALVSRDA